MDFAWRVCGILIVFIFLYNLFGAIDKLYHFNHLSLGNKISIDCSISALGDELDNSSAFDSDDEDMMHIGGIKSKLLRICGQFGNWCKLVRISCRLLGILLFGFGKSEAIPILSL